MENQFVETKKIFLKLNGNDKIKFAQKLPFILEDYYKVRNITLSKKQKDDLMEIVLSYLCGE